MFRPAGPSLSEKAENRPSRHRTTPLLSVPIHNVPSVATHNALMGAPLSSGVLGSLKTVKAMPSKRASPSYVPTHKYPSGVCSIACTRLLGNPSSVCHTRQILRVGPVHARPIKPITVGANL